MVSLAQQYRFLYIQTENKQPFYINLNNTILSSSASGYLIISKLNEGNYELNIGFPKNEWPRQVISYHVGKKDEGLLLKNFGERGWGFSNLQNSEVTMAVSARSSQAVTGVVDDDSFTQVLSEVVNTPDLKIREEVPDPVPVFVPEVKQSEPIVANISSVTRLSQNTNDQGQEYTYLSDGDTVSIFIPVSVARLQADSGKIETSVVNKVPLSEEKQAVTATETIEEKPVSTEAKKEEEPLSNPEVTQTEKPSGLKMINSDCKANASDEDFMKLRKKMASEENEVKMVVVAKKAFKSKCYSTAQIKNLSVLFLNDSGRFLFFESAYPFVVDSNNFIGLGSQLTDPYYITRFTDLTRR